MTILGCEKKYHVENVQDYLDAVADSDFFFAKEFPEYGFGVVNYTVNTPTTFPMIENGDTDDVILKKVIRRNCRGLKYDLKTGKILALPHHKFHNIDEREEVLSKYFDFTKPHAVIDKLDGSMIHSLISSTSDTVYWCTKMGVTDLSPQVVEFVKDHPERKYEQMARDLAEMNMTPCFEWCTRKQAIVIDYPVDDLVLTEVRHNFTGEYSLPNDLDKFGEKYNIPVVDHYEGVKNIAEFLESTKDAEGIEGYIIKFYGTQVKAKVKSLWYCTRHRAMDKLTLEKDLLSLILNEEIDDVKGFLAEDIRKNVEIFEKDVLDNMRTYSLSLKEKFVPLYEEYPHRRDFAQNLDVDKRVAGLFFNMFSLMEKNGKVTDDEVFDLLKNKLKDGVGTSTKVEANRDWIGGVRWHDYISRPISVED